MKPSIAMYWNGKTMQHFMYIITYVQLFYTNDEEGY
jgi:hypothetical protein